MSSFQSFIDDTLRKMTNAERRGLYAAGKFLRDEVRKEAKIAGPAAKLPAGQKPGDLRRSIKHRVNGRKLKLTIYTNAGRGLWLEKGTKNKDGTQRIAPEPFMEPTIDHNREEAVKIFADVVKEGMDQI